MKKTHHIIAILSGVFLLSASVHAAPTEAGKSATTSATMMSPADAARADIKKTLGFVPGFFAMTPDLALPGAWSEFKGLQLNPNTAIPPKYKELIGLAVAAQVPCHYCIYAHTKFATLGGATKDEIGEAVTMAAITRHWSTFINGLQLSESKFTESINQAISYIKQQMAGKMTPKAIEVTDAKSALADIKQTFGSTPEFFSSFPAEGLAGAWMEMKSVEMNPKSAIPGKYKTLMGIAVASQIPCKYCVIADTAFAKLEGVTDREIREAIAMASIVRHWSTILNGLQIKEAGFRADVDKLVAGAKKAAMKK